MDGITLEALQTKLGDYETECNEVANNIGNILKGLMLAENKVINEQGVELYLPIEKLNFAIDKLMNLKKDVEVISNLEEFIYD